MKAIVVITALLLVFALRHAAAKPRLPAEEGSGQSKPSEGWELVWSDEFNTSGPPDPRNWGFETGLVRNEELQWYRPENARIRGGRLIIEARQERVRNPAYDAGSRDWKRNREFAPYTSASLSTRGKHAWKYGRFEMRAKVDTRAGLWPAFWTLGVEGEWPSSGEIDIMEFYRGKLLANVAWGTDRRWTARWDSSAKPLAELGDRNWSKKFHVWRMDWDEESIRLYVDGLLLNTTDLRQTVNGDSEGKNPFHQPHYLLLNLAVGGMNGGDPGRTRFPARYEVDYVRVYQKQLPNGTAGNTDPSPSAAPPAALGQWETEIRAFEEMDRRSPPPQEAVLFVGSSSIRFWETLEKDFPEVPVINRGFGGSQIEDSTRFADRIILPYRPRLIVLYAGDNDLAEGKTSDRVFEEYKRFVRTVRRGLPNVRIAFLAIKPSPSRWHLVNEVRAANEKIRRYAHRDPKLDYIDVFTPMLGADGLPRPELYVEDRLHLSKAGYALWTSLAAPYVK